ncbi:MAG: DUF4190 domain-containing protein [Microbacteriaceae bacterium]|nr:MAG: DUF4190 domain-containing protein [Microbacteriaceae bacterium]
MTETTSLPEADAPEQPADLTTTAASSIPENPYAATRAQTQIPTAQPAGPTPGLSIAALVLGIAAIPTGWWFASVAAIVLGFVARSREPQGRTMANWGLALGFVGAFGWIVVALLGLAFFAPFALWGAAFAWPSVDLGFFELF